MRDEMRDEMKGSSKFELPMGGDREPGADPEDTPAAINNHVTTTPTLERITYTLKNI